MRSNQYNRISGTRRFKRVSATFVLLLATVLAGPTEFLTGRSAHVKAMPEFTMGGPSVRVTPNTSVEFKWITDVTWFGEVAVFDNPDAMGMPVAQKRDEDVVGNPAPSTQHTVTIDVGVLLTNDKQYYCRITATDPNGVAPPIFTQTPLLPLFTGAQALSNVRTESITTTGATVSWDANVIGFGRLEYGTATPGDIGTIDDAFNITAHAIELTGLLPGTTYKFRVSNRHAIDGDALASMEGEFTTPSPPVSAVLTQPHAEPRVVEPGQSSTLSVVALDHGSPVLGATVRFEIECDSRGSGTFNGSAAAQVVTSPDGTASAQFTATRRGIVRVKVTSQAAQNALTIPLVVP